MKTHILQIHHGFSTLELTEIPSNELYKYFIEFLPYLSKCEFGGCSHIKEEKCGIKEAVQNGKISEERYQNYQKIYGRSVSIYFKYEK